MTVERIAVTSGLAVICGLAGAARRNDLDEYGVSALVIIGGVIAPLVETLLFQSLPCAIARACSLGTPTIIALCWLPFGFIHLASGWATFVVAGLGSGYYLAHTYVRLRENSFITAYTLTVASHALLNAVAAVGMVYQRGS